MRISIWDDLEELGESTWDVSSDSDEGSVWFYEAGAGDDFGDAIQGSLYANQWGGE
jgi:hypothetical protein